MTEATYTLPKPISTNLLQQNAGKRRIDTKKYAAWKREAAKLLMTQRPRQIEPPYSVSIVVPDDCRIDVDNCAKAPLDALEKAGVLTNDKYVKELRVSWGDEGVSEMLVSVATLSTVEAG